MSKKAILLSVLLSVVLLVGYTIVVYANGLAAKNYEKINENVWTSGKIFVVIMVVAIIFLGIALFLLHLDRKISKLEKQIKP